MLVDLDVVVKIVTIDREGKKLEIQKQNLANLLTKTGLKELE